MVELPPAPPQIAGLPRDHRGYPVPAENTWHGELPSLAVQDYRRVTSLYANMRCAICGFPVSSSELYRLFAFDDARLTIREGRCVRYDAPGHRECMLFAGALCPFFTTATTRRTEGEAKGNVRGKKAALLGFAGVQIAMEQGGQNVTSFRYADVVDQLWFDKPVELHGLLERAAEEPLRWAESERFYWKDEKAIRRAWRATRALVASAGMSIG